MHALFQESPVSSIPLQEDHFLYMKLWLVYQRLQDIRTSSEIQLALDGKGFPVITTGYVFERDVNTFWISSVFYCTYAIAFGTLVLEQNGLDLLELSHSFSYF